MTNFEQDPNSQNQSSETPATPQAPTTIDLIAELAPELFTGDNGIFLYQQLKLIEQLQETPPTIILSHTYGVISNQDILRLNSEGRYAVHAAYELVQLLTASQRSQGHMYSPHVLFAAGQRYHYPQTSRFAGQTVTGGTVYADSLRRRFQRKTGSYPFFIQSEEEYAHFDARPEQAVETRGEVSFLKDYSAAFSVIASDRLLSICRMGHHMRIQQLAQGMGMTNLDILTIEAILLNSNVQNALAVIHIFPECKDSINNFTAAELKKLSLMNFIDHDGRRIEQAVRIIGPFKSILFKMVGQKLNQ